MRLAGTLAPQRTVRGMEGERPREPLVGRAERLLVRAAGPSVHRQRDAAASGDAAPELQEMRDAVERSEAPTRASRSWCRAYACDNYPLRGGMRFCKVAAWRTTEGSMPCAGGCPSRRMGRTARTREVLDAQRSLKYL